MAQIINFESVSKVYKGDIIALRDLSFQADEGEFFFVVGPSGAGKSTVIRLLIRQELPSDGVIRFEELEVTKIPKKMLSLYRQQLGIVFQDLKLIESKTVRENINFALEIVNKPKSEIEDTTDYLLEVVGLQRRADLFPRQLSGGEKQKTAIARALANDPKLFIADEPTGNLDPKTSEEILDILQTVNSWGTTVMVVTHDKDIVDAMNTRVIHMEEGALVGDYVGGYQGDANLNNQQ
jgi:cell division transport system ATP-binding protein